MRSRFDIAFFVSLFCRLPNALPDLDSNDLMLKIMEAYKNNDELVYTLRVKLLLQSGFKLTFATPNEVHLNAESNIDSCLRMMCHQNLYSSKVTRKCKCRETSRNLTTIEINMKDLVSAGIRKLASCLVLKKHIDRSKTCKICKKNHQSSNGPRISCIYWYRISDNQGWFLQIARFTTYGYSENNSNSFKHMWTSWRHRIYSRHCSLHRTLPWYRHILWI